MALKKSTPQIRKLQSTRSADMPDFDPATQPNLEEDAIPPAAAQKISEASRTSTQLAADLSSMTHSSKKKDTKKKSKALAAPDHIVAQSDSHIPAKTRSKEKQPTKDKDVDTFWADTSSTEERRRIREFWLELGEDERRSLLKVEKEAVLCKMKEQQKHSCNCSVCRNKKRTIKDELEILYDTYYEELEHYANHDQKPHVHKANEVIRFPPPDTAFENTYGGMQLQQVEDEDDDDRESQSDYSEDDESSCNATIQSISSNLVKHGQISRACGMSHGDQIGVDNALNVKGGILTVADDILKNHGKRFLDMMERLAERRIQKGGQGDDYFDEIDEDGDGFEGEETNEQRMEDGRRMFQMFAARMFEQRVLAAYREKVAQERQKRLLEELEEEERLQEERERRKQEEKERKKDKKRQLKKQKEEERLAMEARQKAEEAAARAEKERVAEAQRKKREEERLKKKEEQRIRDAERLQKEEQRLQQLKLESGYAAEKERQRKEQEEKKAKERKERKEKREQGLREREKQREIERREKEQMDQRRHQDEISKAFLHEPFEAGNYTNIHNTPPSLVHISNSQSQIPPRIGTPSAPRSSMYLPFEESRQKEMFDSLVGPSQSMSTESFGNASSTMMDMHAQRTSSAMPLSQNTRFHPSFHPLGMHHGLLSPGGALTNTRDMHDMANPLSGSLSTKTSGVGPTEAESYPSLGAIGRPLTPIGQPPSGQRSSSSIGPIGSPASSRMANKFNIHSSTQRHQSSPMGISYFSDSSFGDQRTSPAIPTRADLLDRPQQYTTPLQPDHNSSSDWTNGWTVSSVLSDRVHDKLFGDVLPDPNIVILERAKVAYQKLDEFNGPSPFCTLTELCRMVNDIYRDHMTDVRELYEAIISPQSSFQYLNDSQHGIIVRNGPSMGAMLGNLDDPTRRANMNPSLGIPSNNILSPPFVPNSPLSTASFTLPLQQSHPSTVPLIPSLPLSPVYPYQQR